MFGDGAVGRVIGRSPSRGREWVDVAESRGGVGEGRPNRSCLNVCCRDSRCLLLLQCRSLGILCCLYSLYRYLAVGLGTEVPAYEGEHAAGIVASRMLRMLLEFRANACDPPGCSWGWYAFPYFSPHRLVVFSAYVSVARAAGALHMLSLFVISGLSFVVTWRQVYLACHSWQ